MGPEALRPQLPLCLPKHWDCITVIVTVTLFKGGIEPDMIRKPVYRTAGSIHVSLVYENNNPLYYQSDQRPGKATSRPVSKIRICENRPHRLFISVVGGRLA